MNPKVIAPIRFIVYLCITYALGYAILAFSSRIVGGVYTEDNLVTVSTWGRLWDLSPLLALALAAICGGWILSKK
ncbi:MAG: hypothetical protein Q8P99_01705 [bacterium]|nr:hypothetical protein [bacterium]MDZ4231276.1 hypothetical protein [Patescibacteria group bacterium]